ncbi:hypothetical protein [Ruegeria atlantica]|uniref:hypothetical protein n=1 Tax=Ruegeria atlantica TaxID=81569 RepID=UPI00147D8EED|nr:hypothetical protein [Ruegeria atlantica]
MRETLTRRTLLITALVTGLLLGAGAANHTGFVIGNATPSVPRGLYLKARPDHASYVSFCLGVRHRGIPTYPDLCSPDTPDAPAILKRIAARHQNGSLTVEGDTRRALDSRFLGPVRPQEIRGWWAPWLTERPARRPSREKKP